MSTDNDDMDWVGEWARSTADLDKRDRPGPRDEPDVVQARIDELLGEFDRDPE